MYWNSNGHPLSTLRRLLPEPLIEMHRDTANIRGIEDRAFAWVETPHGKLKMRKIEDHIEVFRNSKGVQEWRAAIGPFLKQPGEILNFGEPVVSAGVKLPSDGVTTSGS